MTYNLQLYKYIKHLGFDLIMIHGGKEYVLMISQCAVRATT